MKLLLVFLLVLGPSDAQDTKKKTAVKQKAHTKATPEQIRKFNQLEAKQKK